MKTHRKTSLRHLARAGAYSLATRGSILAATPILVLSITCKEPLKSETFLHEKEELDASVSTCYNLKTDRAISVKPKLETSEFRTRTNTHEHPRTPTNAVEHPCTLKLLSRSLAI